ncbi:MAG TPA: hypothetical protein VJ951_01455 [Bacteroidales bacterium]|nr:hypothetical protein [Bacteroidales bacterium]
MCYDVTLGQGEIGETDSPGVLFSGAMGPCIAIGIYDPNNRKGYMMHESNAHVNLDVPNFLENVMKETIIDDLINWVAGGGIDSED